jgi:hypothetical protein
MPRFIIFSANERFVSFLNSVDTPISKIKGFPPRMPQALSFSQLNYAERVT